MRLLPSLFGVVLLACGSGHYVSVPEDREPAPPMPIPDATKSTSSVPTGFVTMLSIDDAFVVDARFLVDAPRRSTSGSGIGVAAGGCVANGALGANVSEVSAGTLSVHVPTREGPRMLDVFFDASAKRYDVASLDARIEPGGVLRIRAEGDRVPAFDVELRAAADVVFDVPDVLELEDGAPRDVTLSWTSDGDSDAIFVDLTLGDASVSCSFDGHAGRGTGTIPWDVVADLVARAPERCTRSSCSLTLASKRTREAPLDAWTLVLTHGVATTREVRVVR